LRRNPATQIHGKRDQTAVALKPALFAPAKLLVSNRAKYNSGYE
jgi:hypothetical protein